MGKSDRFKDAGWFVDDESVEVMIGGAGGIGSWLAFLLARAGFISTIYDFDTIEEHNLGGQLFSKDFIKQHKVVAIEKIISNFSDIQISANVEMITKESPTHHFMFSAFDNMDARKDLFEVWQQSFEEADQPPLFIDGRLEMEQLQIFCVTPDTVDKYKEHLFDDSEVEEAACTLKQTSHVAAMIAAMMTSYFTNHVANFKNDAGRTVPFFSEMFVPLAMLKVEV